MTKFFELFAKNVRSILAVSIIYLGFAFLFALLFVKIPEQNKDTVVYSAGIILGIVVATGMYYFGSSKDKSDVDKTDMDIEKKAAGITVTPP